MAHDPAHGARCTDWRGHPATLRSLVGQAEDGTPEVVIQVPPGEVARLDQAQVTALLDRLHALAAEIGDGRPKLRAVRGA